MHESQWFTSHDPDPLLALLRAHHFNRTRRGRKRLRLFGIACARRVRGFMSERGRNWLDLGRRWAETLVTNADRRQVTAQDSWQLEQPGAGVDVEAWRTEQTADYAAWFTLMANALEAAELPAYNAAGVRGIIGMPTGRSGVEHQAERQVQAHLLRDFFSNPSRPANLNPAWLTPTVLALTHVTYENHPLPDVLLDPASLAILADALEDAGCTNAEILGHCRGPGPHLRSCWVVAMLLGKS